MKKKSFFAVLLLLPVHGFTQMRWVNVDSLFGPLPASVQVFRSVDSLDGSPFIGYYVKARLKDRKLAFTVDTTLGRRLTPAAYFERNNQPLVVVNCTFFNFDKNQNLNLVIRDGNIVGYNNHSIPMRGKDTFQYRHPLASALGITKKRKADVAWTLTDSSRSFAYASQLAPDKPIRDSVMRPSFTDLQTGYRLHYEKWKMKTAIGGGPVLVQEGRVKITNNEELKFAGKAIGDKHPRTCIGYTTDGYLIIMAIQGRFPGIAEGATLEQGARLLVGLGCVEALNLDGGGSSCLLINGKETIQPSDKGGQRPVPAVFLISGN
ncbi:MAG TPA: phosphodiester glycosidase family protein [Ferruginibacter sp.]|nr:phosphodiester glycosidase family protein [Chitinophagales bacterium]HNN72784.1 phosphodiester glycosidase family protein [Ferruginibacter sp.]